MQLRIHFRKNNNRDVPECNKEIFEKKNLDKNVHNYPILRGRKYSKLVTQFNSYI